MIQLHRIASLATAAAAVSAFLLLAGCESAGLSPQETAANNYSMLMYSQELDTMPAVAPDPEPVRGPLNVAVAQVGEIAPPQFMLDALRARSDLFGKVIPISGAVAGQQLDDTLAYRPSDSYRPADSTPVLAQPGPALQMTRMRNMARNLGADYLLLFGGDIQHTNTETGLAVFNLTIVGAFVVPSNAIVVNGKAAGALIDLRTAQPVMSFSSESNGNGMAPSAFADNVENGSMLANRKELVKKLTADVVGQMSTQLKSGRATRG